MDLLFGSVISHSPGVITFASQPLGAPSCISVVQPKIPHVASTVIISVYRNYRIESVDEAGARGFRRREDWFVVGEYFGRESDCLDRDDYR